MNDYNPGRGHWHDILRGAGLSDRDLSGRQGPCPISGCGGKDRFRFDDKDERGTWYCNVHGAGDGYSLLMALTGQTFKACHGTLLARYPDNGEPIVPKPTRDHRKALNALWSKGIAHHPAMDAYFKQRGLVLPRMPTVMRYTAYCPYYIGSVRHTAPAILARVFERGKPVTIHRTYLADDVPSKRMLMPHNGTLHAAYIPLGGNVKGGQLGVAEGIETALAARAMHDPLVPVWSCINADMLSRFEPPKGVDILSIYGDNDKKFTGQAAAFALAKRLSLRADSVSCRVLIPSDAGFDWNDVLLLSQRSTPCVTT